jgi:hypothetical protein
MRGKVHTMRIKGTNLSGVKLNELLPYLIIGAEGDGDGEGEGGENGAGDSGDGSGDGDPGDGDGDADGDSDGSDDGEKPDVKGLKSALEKERAANKQKDKELKALRKAKEAKENAEKSDVERAEAERTAAVAKAEKLAEGFLRTNINGAIRRAAEKAGFIDPDDAVGSISREDITFEQDEDDPSDVDIDQKSVEKAVKALATKKPHFVKSGTDDGGASGSQFGGSKQKGKKSSDDQLRERYPSLR